MPEIVMPKLSDTMTEGTLVAWRKKIGDKVAAGEVLAEIETDKATMEWEAVDDGVLTEIFVQEGGKVDVGQPIAFVQAKGEAAPERKAPSAPEATGEKSPPPSVPAKASQAPAAAAAPASAPAKNPAKKGAQTAGASRAEGEGERIKASPLARKVAEETGVSLSEVEGTGPGGRITREDVLAAAGQGAKPARAQAAPAPVPSRAEPAAPAAASGVPPVKPVPAMAAGANDTRTPLTGMRRVIAERLLVSKTTIPHFYLFAEVDAGELMKLRSEINAASERAGQGKFTVGDFVLKACVMAAARVPAVNASFDGDAIIQYGGVHFAVAVAVDEGLVTPVIRDAQTKTLRELSDAVKDLATRARSKKLKPDEYQGGTLTLSNLGAYGVESFAAIINPPQSVIVSVGSIVKKPVVNSRDEIVVGQRMSVGLSCDHRVVDGAVGARYLAELRQLIENPTLMLV